MATNINPITNRELPYYPFYPWFLRAAPGAFWPQYPAYYFGYPYSYPAFGGMFRDLHILGCSDISAEAEVGVKEEEEDLEDFIGAGKPYMLQRRLYYAFKK